MDVQPCGLEFSPYVTKWRVSVTRMPDGSGEGIMTRLHVFRGHYGPEGGACEVPRPRLLPPPEQSEEARRAESAERAIRRARKQVRLAVKAFGCDHLLTVTYRGAMADPERLKADWARFVRAVVARYPGWVYVACPELHKSGGLHVHAAVRGRQDVKWLRRCWQRAIGGRGDEAGAESLGNIDVRPPRARAGSTWSRDTLALYLSKYVSKSFEATAAHARRYWASKGARALQVRTVLWLDARNEVEAIEQTYAIVAGGNVVGVTHWCTADGAVYWCSTEGPPKPPF